MTSNNENNQALQQALATIAAQQKTLDAQQKTLDAQGKLLEQHTKTIGEHTKTIQGHARTLVAYQEHITNQGKKNDDLEQRIQQVEEALRKSTTASNNPKAKVNKDGRASTAPSFQDLDFDVGDLEADMEELKKDTALREEWTQAFCEYYDIDNSDEARRERKRAEIDFYRSQKKGTGAAKLASFGDAVQSLRACQDAEPSSIDGLAEDPRSASPWFRLSTASSSTMK